MLPGRVSVGAPPADFETITIPRADGTALAAWYKTSENGAVIVALHGAGDSREKLRTYIEMLASHGYGVLAVDLSGHGLSEGRTNRFGWQSSKDASAASEYLQAQPGVDKIGGLGLSLGGEALLGAAGENPALGAIAADGATQRSTAELLALPKERSLFRNFTARVMYATVGLLSGQQPPTPILKSIQAAGSTQFLLIAAGEEQREIEFNQIFAEAIGSRARLWVVPGAAHTGAFQLDRGEYERRLIAFFDQALLETGGGD